MPDNKGNDLNSISLIYEDAYRSTSQLIGRIDSLGSRLTLILGFEAAFVKLAADLPSEPLILIRQDYLQLVDLNSCLILKLLAFLFLIIAILFALCGIYPTPTLGFLDPVDQLEDESIKNKQEFQEKVIRLLADNSISELKKLLSKRARMLKFSLATLGCASIFSAIDLMIQSITG